MSTVWRSPASATASALVALSLAAAPATAASPPASEGHLEPTVGYLQASQNADGGFGDAVGEPSDPQVSAWAAIALAATGINPLDQRAASGQSAYGYLASQAGALALVPDFERELLVADAAGTGTHDFGGRDIAAALLADALPDGSYPYRAGETTPDVNDTSFAILALSPVDESAARRSAEWLVSAQNHDGSWPSTCPRTIARCREGGIDPPGEVDATAAAVEALNAAGLHGTGAQGQALAWLRGAQLTEGGLPEYPAEPEANTASTAWAAQALWAAAISPEGWHAPDGDPLSYMASMQQPDGSIAWRAGQSSEPVWMTAYVVPAFAGRPLPIVGVPRQAPPQSGPQPTASEPVLAESQATTAAPGAPGRSTGVTRAAGVRSGGGGAGAPLFSRPLPQSGGRTPGAPRRAAARPGGTGGHALTASGATTRAVRAGPAPARRIVNGLLLGTGGPASPGLAGAVASASGSNGARAAVAVLVLAVLLFALGAVVESHRRDAVL